MHSQECSIHGCNRNRLAKGLCGTHYAALRRNGDPLARRVTPRGAPRQWLEAHASHNSADECLIWPFARKSDGYPIIAEGGRCVGAHRLMCTLAHGPSESSKMHAAHSCGRGRFGCVNPQHLRWATIKENAADKSRHGSDNAGNRNGNSILTANHVAEIRAMFATGEFTQKHLASVFGVAPSTIWTVINNRSWTSVAPGDLETARAA